MYCIAFYTVDDATTLSNINNTRIRMEVKTHFFLQYSFVIGAFDCKV